MSKKIQRGGWSGFGMALVWIDPNYFGSLCSNPNKIQTNDMVGGVIYFCHVFLSGWQDGAICRALKTMSFQNVLKVALLVDEAFA